MDLLSLTVSYVRAHLAKLEKLEPRRFFIPRMFIHPDTWATANGWKRLVQEVPNAEPGAMTRAPVYSALVISGETRIDDFS